jgi:hypothetical protein
MKLIVQFYNIRTNFKCTLVRQTNTIIQSVRYLDYFNFFHIGMLKILKQKIFLINITHT